MCLRDRERQRERWQREERERKRKTERSAKSRRRGETERVRGNPCFSNWRTLIASDGLDLRVVDFS